VCPRIAKIDAYVRRSSDSSSFDKLCANQNLRPVANRKDWKSPLGGLPDEAQHLLIGTIGTYDCRIPGATNQDDSLVIIEHCLRNLLLVGNLQRRRPEPCGGQPVVSR